MIRSDFSAQRYLRHARGVAMVGAAVLFAAWRCDVNLADLAKASGKVWNLGLLFFPPDWESFPRMIGPALITVFVAAVATPIGTACAVVVGLASARNIAPPWLRLTARSLMAFERGVPEIVLVLVLVAAFGVGPFTGVAGLTIASIGMLGKLVGDAIEEIDVATVESVACVGATRSQLIRYAVLPQVMPSLLANSMFRFEVNIRASVLLGAIGAGGIGYELMQSMNQLEYHKATVAVVVSLLLVFIAERLSDAIRSRLVAGARLT
jgi:phosphonate transport system permease protein